LGLFENALDLERKKSLSMTDAGFPRQIIPDLIL
jgi:hypothetical protein